MGWNLGKISNKQEKEKDGQTVKAKGINMKELGIIIVGGDADNPRDQNKEGGIYNLQRGSCITDAFHLSDLPRTRCHSICSHSP